MPRRCLQISFYLLPFFLPTYLLKLPLNQGSINVLDIFQLFILAQFVIFLVSEKKYAEFFSYLKIQPKFILLCLLILIVLGSWLYNFSPSSWSNGLGIIKSYFILPILISLVFYLLLKEKIIYFEKFALSYFIFSSLISVISLFFLLANNLTYDGRLQAIYNSPNFLAMVVSPGIIIGVFFLLLHPLFKDTFPNIKKLKPLVIVLIVFPLIVICLTRSLGAFLGLSLAIMSLVFLPHLKNYYFLAIKLTLVAFLIILLLPFFVRFFNYAPASHPTSQDSRLAIYLSSGKIFKDHWVLGIGPGNFQEKYLDYQKYFLPYPQWAVPHSHNLLLHLATETGTLGLIIFVLLIFSTIKKPKLPIEALPKILLIYFFDSRSGGYADLEK